MPESLLLTHRRNFLVRALAFTAAGASMSVPIVSVASAQDRVKHHMKGLENAWRDLYAGASVLVTARTPDPQRVIHPESEEKAIFIVIADQHPKSAEVHFRTPSMHWTALTMRQ